MKNLTLNDVIAVDLCLNDLRIGEHLCLTEKWNGWYAPLIHEHDIERIAKILNDAMLLGGYESYDLIVRKDGNWIVECYEENNFVDHYDLTTYMLNGEFFIEIGNNWVWESAEV
jgi:hypothetical protein